jgi:hypothetical protein
MSSLTVALAALGGVVLAGVVAHGAWQARKASPKRVLVQAPREEPAAPSEREMREPTLGDEAPVADTGTAEPTLEVRVPRRAVARLDALIDAIATLTIEAPLAAEFVLLHLPPSRRAGGKPFLIEGLNTETGEWEAPSAGQRYGELQAGVHRRAERDRVLRVRAEGAGLCRSRRRDARLSRHARRGGTCA